MKNNMNIFEKRKEMTETLAKSIYSNLDFKNILKVPKNYDEIDFKEYIFSKIIDRIDSIYEDIIEYENDLEIKWLERKIAVEIIKIMDYLYKVYQIEFS